MDAKVKFHMVDRIRLLGQTIAQREISGILTHTKGGVADFIAHVYMMYWRSPPPTGDAMIEAQQLSRSHAHERSPVHAQS